MKELKLVACDATLYTVLDELRACLEEHHCAEELITPIMIAAEEIYVNIAHYAYGGDEGEAKVNIDVSPNPNRVRLVFKDRGVPYNPLEKEDPNIEASEEERGIGGLGIYMVKEIMDNVTYEYRDGQNILTIEKALE